MRKNHVQILITIAVLVSAGIAMAAEPPPSAVVIESKSDMLKTSMTMIINKRAKKVSCGKIESKWRPGMKTREYFYPLSGYMTDKKNELAALKAYQESGFGDAATKKSIKSTAALIKSLKSYLKPAAVACKAAARKSNSGGGGASPTPTPGSGGGGGGGETYFSGDCLTATGKAALGVPSGVNACKSAGQSLHSAHACTSCHGEKSNRTYSQLMASYSLPTMSALPHSSGDVGALVAYLNRSRQ